MLDGFGCVGVLVCDIGCGMFVYEVVFGVLICCGQIGCGQVVEVLFFEVMVEWMSVLYLFECYGEGVFGCVGFVYLGIVFYGVFCSGDD